MAENSDLLMLPSRILSTLEDYEQALYDSAMETFTAISQQLPDEIWSKNIPLEREEPLAKICECGGELVDQGTLSLRMDGPCFVTYICSKCGKKAYKDLALDDSSIPDSLKGKSIMGVQF